jgi:hypothetical protein
MAITVTYESEPSHNTFQDMSLSYYTKTYNEDRRVMQARIFELEILLSNQAEAFDQVLERMESVYTDIIRSLISE